MREETSPPSPLSIHGEGGPLRMGVIQDQSLTSTDEDASSPSQPQSYQGVTPSPFMERGPGGEVCLRRHLSLQTSPPSFERAAYER